MADQTKPWLKQPGETFDRNGVPIYPGDLLKTYSFTGRRRKKYYLYHVVVWDKTSGGMRLVPTMYMDPAYPRTGGEPLLSDSLAAGAEVISGLGPDRGMYYDERPRRKNPLRSDAPAANLD